MAKNSYIGQPPSAMRGQREGTPTTAGGPPPHLDPAPYSRPRTVPVPPTPPRPTNFVPQPDKRPGERTMGNEARERGTLAQKPTGTVVPERRSEKAGRGSGGVPGEVGFTPQCDPADFDVFHPSMTPGYTPPKRG